MFPQCERMKMICWILLLIKLSCCVCAPTFEVKSTQSFYQAEEKQNVTLEWTFPPPADGSLTSLEVVCFMIFDVKVSFLLELIGGVQVSESEDGQFAGRVHCDTDVLKEGRLRLHMSSLRTEDSGTYLCNVRTESDRGRGESLLNVGAAAHEPEPQRPAVRPGPESRGRPGLYVGLGLGLGLVLLAASAVLVLCVIKKCVIESVDKRGLWVDPKSLICSLLGPRSSAEQEVVPKPPC